MAGIRYTAHCLGEMIGLRGLRGRCDGRAYCWILHVTSSKASLNLHDIIMGNNEEAYPRGGEASIFNREGLLEKGQWREGERSGEHVSTAGADMGEREASSL